MPQAGVSRYMRRVNLGNYEHAEATAEISWAEVDGGSPQAASDMAVAEVARMLNLTPIAGQEIGRIADAVLATGTKDHPVSGRLVEDRPATASTAPLPPTQDVVSDKPDLTPIDHVTLGRLLADSPPSPVVTDKDRMAAAIIGQPAAPGLGTTDSTAPAIINPRVAKKAAKAADAGVDPFAAAPVAPPATVPSEAGAADPFASAGNTASTAAQVPSAPVSAAPVVTDPFVPAPSAPTRPSAPTGQSSSASGAEVDNGQLQGAIASRIQADKLSPLTVRSLIQKFTSDQSEHSSKIPADKRALFLQVLGGLTADDAANQALISMVG